MDADLYRANICKRLRETRKRSEYKTQHAMATELQISANTYATYESRTLLPHHLIPSSCELLNCSPWYLLTGRPRQFAPPITNEDESYELTGPSCQTCLYRIMASVEKSKKSEQITQGHCTFDKASNQYVSVSEEYAQIFGYTANEFMRQFLNLEEDMQLVHPDDRAWVAETYDRCRKSTGTNLEYRVIRADGRTRIIHEEETLVPDSQTIFKITLRDITELRLVSTC